MKYHNLPLLPPVSSICLGAGQYGSQMNATAAYQLLDAFVEAGGNFVDSAHIYGVWDKNGAAGGCGNSEVVIGHWMKNNNCRNQMIIGTKGGHPDFDSGESRMSQKWIHQHLHESLEHLQTDYIDIYYFHRDDLSIPVSKMLEWMKEPVQKGIIRLLACSNWRPERLLEARAVAAINGLPLLATNQISWSLAHPNETRIINKYGEQTCMDQHTWETHVLARIPIVAYNSQAGGYFSLLDKLTEVEIAMPGFPKTDLIKRYNNPVTAHRRRLAQEMARRKGCSTHHLALAWMLNQPFPTFPVIGPKTVPQLKDSLDALKVEITPDEVKMLTEAGGDWM